MNHDHGGEVQSQGGQAEDGEIPPQQGAHFGGDDHALQDVGQQEQAVGDVDIYCTMQRS